MENKINIAELLKDCPRGMELDCSMYDNLYFNELNADYHGTINCYTLIDGIKTSIDFTKYGTFNTHMGAKCVIFPKGKTTWEGFQKPFKNGDIIYIKCKYYDWCSIFYKCEDEKLYTYVDICITSNNFYCSKPNIVCECSDIIEHRFATEEEKEKLFKAIKENGYRWDTKNKTLEKLPMFKVGDKIKLKGGDVFGIITQIADCYYTIKCKHNTYCWPIKKQDNWELINEPKFKVGDKIKDKNNRVWFVVNVSEKHFDISSIPVPNAEGYFVPIEDQDNWELVPNKFDISTLVPFESRVLIRDSKSQKWSPAIWGFYDSDSQDYRYKLVGIIARYCIPYEGNEHLLGTTDDCGGYYKIW